MIRLISQTYKSSVWSVNSVSRQQFDNLYGYVRKMAKYPMSETKFIREHLTHVHQPMNGLRKTSCMRTVISWLPLTG